MKKHLRVLFFSLILGATSAFAEVASGTGLQISANGDLVGTFGGQEKNRLEAREAELVIYAPIDHYFDGNFSIAAHQENGTAFFEIHELTIGSTKLIPRSRFRLGQYFLGIGRLNQFHRHDWPFTSAPKVQSEFLHSEGILDTGLEYGYLLPLPFYLDLTVGVTNGWVFGHAHNEGTKPLFPTHYARLATYNDIFGGGMQTGLNYLGRKDNQGTNTTLLGLDLTAKWKESTILKFLFQSEVWYRIKRPRGADSEKALGFYLYPQYGFDANWQIGVRLDGYTITSLQDAAGAKIANFDYALVPTLTYKASEFSTLRASYNFKGTRYQGRGRNEEQVFELQAVFILGSHPAHDF
jgi:hypothetical protein